MHAFEALAKPNSDATVDKRKDHRNPPPRNDSPVFVITQLQGIVDSYKALQQGDLMRALISRRAVFKRILLYHDAIIRHVSVPPPFYSPPFSMYGTEHHTWRKEEREFK